MAPPKRLLIMVHTEGSLSAQFTPMSGGERDFVLSPAMTALSPWRSRMLLLDGLHLQAARDAGIDPHDSAVAGILTGRAPGRGQRSGSLDQHVADAMRGPARLRSLELTCGIICVNGSYPCFAVDSDASQPLPALSGALSSAAAISRKAFATGLPFSSRATGSPWLTEAATAL